MMGIHQAQPEFFSYRVNLEHRVRKDHPLRRVAAALVRKGGRSSARPRYHHHRAVDDAHGVITAVETTPGSIAENKKLSALIEQHEANTEQKADTVVGDSKYGTNENLAACVAAEIRPHLGVLEDKQKKPAGRAGLYEEKDFA